MTETIAEKMDDSMNNNELLASLLQTQEKQLQLLKQMNEKQLSSPSSNLEQQILSLQTSMNQLQAEWGSAMQQIESMSEQTKIAHQKSAEHAETLRNAHIKIIEQQAKTIKTYRSYTLVALLRHFIRPLLGTLHQHDSRLLYIPKRYRQEVLELKNPPTISIVTPSYNQGEFIEKTILSILNQNYPALQYIVQDGGSDDETVSILEKYQSKLKHWESKKDKGQSNALNLGFQHATGEILAYLNSDDILLPGSLNYIAHYFEQHPEVDVVYGHRVIINEYNQEIGRWVLPPHDSHVLTWADYIPQETLFWRRRAWEKIGGTIDENFRFAMDWDLLLRLRDSGARFMRLPRFLGAFRVHLRQKTSTTISDLGEREMMTLRRRYHDYDVSQQEIRRSTRLYLIRHTLCHKLYKLGILRY